MTMLPTRLLPRGAMAALNRSVRRGAGLAADRAHGMLDHAAVYSVLAGGLPTGAMALGEAMDDEPGMEVTGMIAPWSLGVPAAIGAVAGLSQGRAAILQSEVKALIRYLDSIGLHEEALAAAHKAATAASRPRPITEADVGVPAALDYQRRVDAEMTPMSVDDIIQMARSERLGGALKDNLGWRGAHEGDGTWPPLMSIGLGVGGAGALGALDARRRRA